MHHCPTTNFSFSRRGRGHAYHTMVQFAWAIQVGNSDITYTMSYVPTVVWYGVWHATNTIPYTQKPVSVQVGMV